GENRIEPLWQQVVGRHRVRDTRVVDLVFGPDQALAERGLRDEQGARNLSRGQATERAQRQGDLRLQVQRRVTAREDEPQPFIAYGLVVIERHRCTRFLSAALLT